MYKLNVNTMNIGLFIIPVMLLIFIIYTLFYNNKITEISGGGGRGCGYSSCSRNQLCECKAQACSSNLDCPYPFKCCDSKCKKQIMISKIRGDNLYVPRRMSTCPASNYLKKCNSNSDCQSNFINCVNGNCENKQVYYSGVFENLQKDSY